MVAARILRLGFNLLFMDTDVVVFDDPYKYFKVWVTGIRIALALSFLNLPSITDFVTFTPCRVYNLCLNYTLSFGFLLSASSWK